MIQSKFFDKHLHVSYKPYSTDEERGRVYSKVENVYCSLRIFLGSPTINHSELIFMNELSMYLTRRYSLTIESVKELNSIITHYQRMGFRL